MQPFILKCHCPGATSPPSAFFILSRGRHTGRPAFTANPNCFVFTCDPQDLAGYYWLVYLLWKNHRFKSILKGTCIEFARIEEVRQLIVDNTLADNNLQLLVNTLEKLQFLENSFKNQLVLIALARKSLLRTD